MSIIIVVLVDELVLMEKGQIVARVILMKIIPATLLQVRRAWYA